MFAVVVAHPDDEAFSWAGTVALHADDARFRFVLVHATRGEAGDIRPGFSATRDTLGAIRQAAGPWRTSGDWWRVETPAPWDDDEWDVVLESGCALRLAHDRRDHAWVVVALID